MLSPKLEQYKALLLKWSKSLNLVAPSTLAQADSRHFQDSTQLLKFLPETTKIVFDLGSGAGFPGLVLATERPDLEFHLFESDTKKCSFLGAVSREISIPVTIHNQRIELVDRKTLPYPDVITARALTSLTDLLKMTEFWWQQNPHLILLFPKGGQAETEIIDAQKNYRFEIERFPSLTDKTASILRLSSVHKL
jgi:16S rRNA (guanine527-N7)-methyltransferase